MRMRFPLLLATLLLLAGCQLTIVAFTVPAVVMPGQAFDVAVTLAWNATSGSGGVVLQIPNGFVVLGTSSPGSSVVRDDPALLATYAAEPGHYLASWSRNDATFAGSATYYAYVQAPAVATTAAFKVSLAGRPSGQPWLANDPVGVTQFAQITAAPHVRTITVGDVLTTAFTADAQGLPYGTVYTSMWSTALHDLDGDGDDDLLANDRVFFRGAATWTESSAGLAMPQPLTRMRVAAGDFDGDGIADLVHGRGAVFYGDGAGSWTPGPSFGMATQTNGVGVGDVNGDGCDDIAFGGYFTNHLRVFLGNFNRSFTDASTGLPASPFPFGQDVLLRDVTGDGHLDIVWHEVWAGDGFGNWTPSTGLVGNAAEGVAAGDLDGDGLPELVHANGSAGVTVHRHLGGNAWAVAATFAPANRSIHNVALLDHDRDGRLDLVFGYHDATNGIELRRNLGGFVFATVANSGLPATTATYVNDLAVGDVNGDTFPDLAVVFFGQGTLVYQNRLAGTSTFGLGCAAALTPPPQIAGVGAPLLGSATFAVRTSGGQPGTLALLWFGTSRRTWNGAPALPLSLDPLGAFGCTLWTGPEALAAGAFDTAGAFTVGLPIPASPLLHRVTVFAQAAAQAAGSPGLGLALSGGLAIRVD